ISQRMSVLQLKGPVPSAEQNRDVVASEVGDRDVEMAVVVEVAERQPRRNLAACVGLQLRLERTVPLVQKNRNVVVNVFAQAANDQVELAVAIQVSRHH